MEEKRLQEAMLGADTETGCNIDIDVTREEASWYSMLNAISLALGSGMGIPMDEDEANKVLGNAGLCITDLPLSNPSLLKAIYKSGDPHLMQNYDEHNLNTWRWPRESFDRSLRPQAQGWAIIAETECARMFESAQSSGKERGQWSQTALLLAILARRQCEFAFSHLRDGRGLFAMSAEEGSVHITDSNTNLEDQMCMLWACSDAASFAGKQGIFMDENAHNRFMLEADALFSAILENKATLLDTSINKIQAQAVAVSSLAWYSTVTRSDDLRAAALRLLREYADNLVGAQDASESVGTTLVDAAEALRALTEAFRVTKLRTYAEAATKIFDYMESQWWKLPGVYAQTPLSTEYTYNADEVAVIVGALNAARLFLKERINRELADLRMRLFFCKTVNTGGMQMSVPSADFLPTWLPKAGLEDHICCMEMTLPGEAGGAFGIAPVFAGEVSYDPQSDTWAQNLLFDTQAAMRACCEFIRLHNEVRGYPELDLSRAPASVREAAGVEAS